MSIKSQKPVPVGDSESGRRTQQIAVSSHPPSSAGRPHSGPVHTTSRDAGSVASGNSASSLVPPPPSVSSRWDVKRTGSESVPALQIPSTDGNLFVRPTGQTDKCSGRSSMGTQHSWNPSGGSNYDPRSLSQYTGHAQIFRVQDLGHSGDRENAGQPVSSNAGFAYSSFKNEFERPTSARVVLPPPPPLPHA